MDGARLIGRILPRDQITRSDREQMFALMDRYYEGMRLEEFERDLAEKQWIIQVIDPLKRAIRGFSTQKLLYVECNGRPVRALFSGDTIVDRECWSGNPLAQLWGRFALSLIDAVGGEGLYWFLISKGFRTYRFLPLFFHEYYPRPGAPAPLWAKETIDVLARARFPRSYDSAAGVVRAGVSKCRLRAGVGEINSGRIADSDVRFFVERNPGHIHGDELCCLAPLTRENFTRAAWRTIGTHTGSGVNFGETVFEQHEESTELDAHSFRVS